MLYVSNGKRHDPVDRIACPSRTFKVQLDWFAGEQPARPAACFLMHSVKRGCWCSDGSRSAEFCVDWLWCALVNGERNPQGGIALFCGDPVYA
jgi:hypothetical protein